MYVRKIQLIAGTTYSVSLPKEWVMKNGLDKQRTVSMTVNKDQTLIISPKKLDKDLDSKEFSLSVDEYGDTIEQILFSLFYTGYEDITLYSVKGIPPEIQSLIKRVLSFMSGTEIVYEDSHKIKLKVLLDTEKLDIHQIFFRIYLLINSTISILEKDIDKDALSVNENEIDRLYHLLVKLISRATLQPHFIVQSNIGSPTNILSYLLIAKRLEHLGDNLYRMITYYEKSGDKKVIHPLLNHIKDGVHACVNALVSKEKTIFQKTDQKKVNEFNKKVDTLEDEKLQLYLRDSLRCLSHIEEELVTVSFAKQMSGKE